jgi:hypothetical protein
MKPSPGAGSGNVKGGKNKKKRKKYIRAKEKGENRGMRKIECR